MPRPTSQPPASVRPAADEPVGPAPLPRVRAAEGAGTHYADKTPGRPPRKSSRPARPPRPEAERIANWPQLGTRIRPELYELLVHAADEKHHSRSYIVSRGLELVLSELGYEPGK